MLFASKTPEQAGFEPRPYRFYSSGLATAYPAGTHTYYDPDNAWLGLQTNDTNRILSAWREEDDEDVKIEFYGWLAGDDERPWPFAFPVTLEEIEHAFLVLSRLSYLELDSLISRE